VVFGDPDDGDGFPGVLNDRSITFCAFGDDICAGGILVLPPHLSYGAVGYQYRAQYWYLVLTWAVRMLDRQQLSWFLNSEHQKVTIYMMYRKQ
jgi:hypothetical protein